MANPEKPDIDYSYTGFAQEAQVTPFPGPALDNDLAELKRGIDDTIDALIDIRRSDGKLVNGIVTRDSLSAEVTDLAGQSAYGLALSNGFEGTEEEWLASLVGPTGATGATGPAGATGATGATGAAGAAATIAVGTVTTGDPGTDVIVTNVGTSAAAVFDITIPRGDTGASGSGSGDMLAANNLSELVSAATARTNLGLEIGVDVQAYNADLAAIVGLAKTDGNVIVGNGTTWVAESGATARTSLGLAIGTDVQAYNANLATLAGVTPGATGLALLDDTSASAARTTLGLVIGTNVQAYSANLASLAAATPGTLGLALLDDADAAAGRTTLGLGSAAVLTAGDASGNLKALNADAGFTFDTAAAPTQAWAISDQFAGAYRTVHVLETTDTSGVNAGGKSTLAVSRTVTGAGTAGVGLADVAAHFMVQKDNLNGTAVGEIDGLKVNVFQNAWTDAGGILIGAYKKVGDGSADEGALTSMEISTRRFTTDISTYDHWHQNIVGFSPNPTSTWGSRAPIGFYSENHQGTGFANFLGITDGASGTTGTMTYLLAGFRERDIATRYFSVDDEGNIESIWLDAGAAGGSWKRHKDSASPAANDILWNDYWTGNDSGGNETDYVRMYGVIEDPTNGSEDGSLRILTRVNGAETQQMRIQNGVAIGTSASALGTNTLNVQTSIALNGTVRIDGDGAARMYSVTTTNLADIGHAVNTANKVAGKVVWASNNGKLYVALGSATNSGWQPADSASTITPA